MSFDSEKRGNMREVIYRKKFFWKKQTKQLKRLCRAVQVVPLENGVRNIQVEWFIFQMICGGLPWLRMAEPAF